MGKIAAKEGEKRALPGSYSEMYPNRFLKADMLKGKPVTLTIKSIVGEGLMTEDGGANLEWVVSFEERPLQFVMNKTNAFCLYRMFGGDPHSWVNKKVTLFPTTVMAFGARHECIRVFGSPDIPEDIPITVPQGRKKAWETVMKATKVRAAAPASATVTADPRIMAAWGILDWTEKERSEDRSNFAGTDAEYLVRLNSLIDERNVA
jgi:hypothetical protein